MDCSKIIVPDGSTHAAAFARTTDICIAAHQDDVEIMAYGPISECYKSASRGFTAVIVTDGAGSPRTGIYSAYTDEDMKLIRRKEQLNAAIVGEYSALALLGWPSADVKRADNEALINELTELFLQTRPTNVYTHNLADKHDTHVAVALRVIEALRRLPADARPQKVYGMEVWRGLDWLCDEDKATFDTSARENLAASLLGIFDSQVSGGKRYDLAATGRRVANATFFASHAVDECGSMSYGLDLTPLVYGDVDPGEFIGGYIEKFRDEVAQRIKKYT